MKRRALACLCLLLTSVACSDPPATTPTPVLNTVSTETFVSTLSPGGSTFYSFNVGASGGTVSLTLASVTAGSAGALVRTPVGLGIGTPAGEGCAMTSAVNATIALTAQLSTNANPGTTCVNIYDVGGLTSTVTFAVRIVHP